MSLLTNPLKADQPKIEIELVEQGSFRLVQLPMHRRAGSDQYVELVPTRNDDLQGPWADIPAFDWTSAIDQFGDDDLRPETESVDFSIFEFDPNELPAEYFFRVESREVAP